MSKCPLCENDKQVTLNTFDIKLLSRKWLKDLGFDPFKEFLAAKALKKIKCTNCNLEYFSPHFFGDNHFYEKISKNKWYYESNKWEFEEALKVVTKFKPESLLEIGCGSGLFLEKVTSYVTNTEGVDINADAVKLCLNKNLNVQKMDILSEAFFDGNNRKYDMVVLFEVLEHLQYLKQILNTIDKILNENGCLVIAVPNPEGYLKYCETVLLDMPPHHNTIWSKDVFEYVSRKYKYSIVDYLVEPLRYEHYIGYLLSIFRSYRISNYSIVNNILLKIGKMIISLFAPFYYMGDKERILGQTHLIVYRKIRHKTIENK